MKTYWRYQNIGIVDRYCKPHLLWSLIKEAKLNQDNDIASHTEQSGKVS